MGFSLAAYPVLGWAAIGVAEIMRALTVVIAEKLGGRSFSPSMGGAAQPRGHA
jgi:hypothetical protein